MNNQLIYGPDRLQFAKTPMILSQWVLDYKPVKSQQGFKTLASSPALNTPTSFSAHSSRHPRPVNAQTLDEWHEYIGHLYPKALLHLPQTTSGTEVTTSQLSNPKCENYCLSNSAKRPYRHAVIRSDVPFF